MTDNRRVFCEFTLSHWGAVRAGLLATIDKFQDADLSFKAFEGAYSVAELILHIAHEEHLEFAYGILEELPDFPPAYSPEDYPTLEAIKSLLETVHAHTLQELASLDDVGLNRSKVAPWGPTYSLLEMYTHILEHEIHHRGELSFILGILGRKGLDA